MRCLPRVSPDFFRIDSNGMAPHISHTRTTPFPSRGKFASARCLYHGTSAAPPTRVGRDSSRSQAARPHLNRKRTLNGRPLGRGTGLHRFRVRTRGGRRPIWTGPEPVACLGYYGAHAGESCLRALRPSRRTGSISINQTSASKPALGQGHARVGSLGFGRSNLFPAAPRESAGPPILEQQRTHPFSGPCGGRALGRQWD